MKTNGSIRGILLCLTAATVFTIWTRPASADGAEPRYGILAGAGLGRRISPERNARNRDFQDEMHVLGLYINLRGGPDAYSAPIIPRPSDEEPAGSAPPPARRKTSPPTPSRREADAKIRIHYRAQMLLLLRPGSRYYDRDIGTSNIRSDEPFSRPGRQPADSSLFFLPGRNLYLGLDPKYCGDCSLLLGYADSTKNSPGDPAGILTGGRGGALGLHLRFAHPAYGELRVLPYFLPAFSERASGIQGGPRDAARDAALFYDSSFARDRPDDSDTGSRLEYRLKLAGLELGLHYARRRMRSESALLRTEYTGFGLGAELPAGFSAYLSLERMQGELREERSMASPSKAPPPRPTGGALRMSGDYRRGDFHIQWNVFLPQAAERKPGERETTGYILAGANPLDSLLLAGTLDARPAPRARNILEPAPELNGNPLSGLEHAGVFSLDAAWTRGIYEFTLGLDFLQPLSAKEGGGPFAVKKKDGESYAEISLGMNARMGRSKARLAWSRLYFRGSEGRRTAGESIYFILEYAP